MTDLTFHLGDVEDDSGLLPTTCNLSVSIGGMRIWPVRGDEECALEIEIDDLLSHLSEAWKPLILRQTYPGNFILGGCNLPRQFTPETCGGRLQPPRMKSSRPLRTSITSRAALPACSICRLSG